MKLHPEGTATILFAISFALVLFVISYYSSKHFWISIGALILGFLLVAIVLYFFRVPAREHVVDSNTIFSPANGEVVVVEKVYEKEFIKQECIQISIFMSPLNVHLNRYPINGKIVYSKYHPGKYLVAWAPKSSKVNESHSVGIEHKKGTILVKQIAGFLARRIVNYAKVGTEVEQHKELGFIKFGSRVDVFVPLDTKINVQVGDKTIEGITPLAQYH